MFGSCFRTLAVFLFQLLFFFFVVVVYSQCFHLNLLTCFYFILLVLLPFAYILAESPRNCICTHSASTWICLQCFHVGLHSLFPRGSRFTFLSRWSTQCFHVGLYSVFSRGSILSVHTWVYTQCFNVGLYTVFRRRSIHSV